MSDALNLAFLMLMLHRRTRLCSKEIMELPIAQFQSLVDTLT